MFFLVSGYVYKPTQVVDLLVYNLTLIYHGTFESVSIIVYK